MTHSSPTGPGAVRVRPGTLTLNTGRPTRQVVIENAGDRPVQVGSHLHLPDANPALAFDRDALTGFRLDICAGTSVRFEPGVSREVDVVEIAGLQRIPGISLRESDHG